MRAEIADEIEMRGKARVGQHAPGVSAYREHFAALDPVMPVELERVALLWHGALVEDRLAVILASLTSSPSSLNSR